MAGTLDPKAVKEDRERRGGDLYTLREGTTVAYLCQPCREDDRLNYIKVGVHYGLRRGPTLCLDSSRNPIWANPHFLEIMKEKGIKTPARCPACTRADKLFRRATTEKEKEEPRRIKYQDKYLWNLIPIAHRAPDRDELSFEEPDLVQLLSGETIWEDITQIICEEGNITKPDEAVFVKMTRKGAKGDKQTKYTTVVDTESVKSPKALPKAIRARLAKALQPDGEGDLYSIASGLYVDIETMADLLDATEFEGGEDSPETEGDEHKHTPPRRAKRVQPDDDGEEETGKASSEEEEEEELKLPKGKRRCFGSDFDPSDDECQDCEFRKKCKAEMTGDAGTGSGEGGDDEGDGDFEAEMEKLRESMGGKKGKGR